MKLEFAPHAKAGRAARYLPLAVILGLAAIALALFFLPIALLFSHLSRAYNEGWNAYHVAHLLSGRPLYPPLDSFASNNYPPLSFFVSAFATLFVGDPLIAGRLVALASLFIVALNIGVVVRRICGSDYLGLFASVYFLIYCALFYNSYTAIFDPQWLGHALQTAGLLFLLGPRDKICSIEPRQAALAALFMLLGGLVKHNLVALPLTAVAWLLLYQRRRAFLSFAGAGLGFLVLSVCVFSLMFGSQWIQDVFLHARVITLWRTLIQIPFMVASMAPYAGIVVITALVGPRDGRVGFVAMYFTIAVVLGFLARMGDGVSINAYFDVGIASVIGVALCCSLLSSIPSSLTRDMALGINVLLLSLPLVGGLWYAIEDQKYLVHQFLYRREAPALIATLRETDGPVACRDLAWCFLAGRDFELDFFNYSQKLLKGRVKPDELLHRIETGYYKRIQLSDLSDIEIFFSDSDVARAIHSYYEEEKRMGLAVLLVPKARP